MKKQILFAILLTGILSAFTLVRVWTVDTSASQVNFELPMHHKKGTFGNLKALIQFDRKDLKGSKISASIDVKTLKANNEKLEAHLLSHDFFDAEKFPAITFASTDVRSVGESYIAKGNLTMKDSTKTIELPFKFLEKDEHHAVFSGTLTLNASDYGVMKKGKAGDDQVIVYLEVPVSE